jgi:hypothetical protein
MGHAHACTRSVCENDRQAVGGHHDAHTTRDKGHGGIGTRRRGACVGRSVCVHRDRYSVHLLEPQRFGRQACRCPQQRAVVAHVAWFVADVLRQIEAGIRARAAATEA